jgi:hypothetical protein
MTEDDSHDVYRRSTSKRCAWSCDVDQRENLRDLSQKNISRTIDVSGFIQVSQHLYGDAARGCHHRGDGPDASQRVISNNRQRLGVLVIEGFAAIPVGSMEPRVRITGEGGYAPWQLRRRQRRSRQRRSRQRRSSHPVDGTRWRRLAQIERAFWCFRRGRCRALSGMLIARWRTWNLARASEHSLVGRWGCCLAARVPPSAAQAPMAARPPTRRCQRGPSSSN